MVFCPECGTKMPDKTKFCFNCGFNLSSYIPEEVKEFKEEFKPVGREELEKKWIEEQRKIKKQLELLKVEKELEKEAEEIAEDEKEKRWKILRKRMERWALKGYEVKRLREALERDLEEAESEFDRFENDIVELEVLTDELNEIKAKEFESEIKAIKSKLRDPEKLDEVKAEISKLKERIAKFEEERVEKVVERRRELEKTLIEEYTFDNFVVGACNRFAHAAAMAVAKAPGKAYNPLFIYGGSGLGKTHLMNAIGNYIVENHSELKVLYIPSEKFVGDLLDAIKTDALTDFRNRYRDVDVLLIDDIHFVAGKEGTQEEFFHLFNALYNAGKQIVLTSDKAPKDIKGLENRLITRFEWGLVTDIQVPDLETKIVILKKKAETCGLEECDDEILQLIAEGVESNIRELEGALNKIVAYSSLTKTEINVETAKEILKDMLPAPEKKKIAPEKERPVRTYAEPKMPAYEDWRREREARLIDIREWERKRMEEERIEEEERIRHAMEFKMKKEKEEAWRMPKLSKDKISAIQGRLERIKKSMGEKR